ncbi:hypothetical protein GBAR_LOCUS20829, partial [Geodia barretti]
TQISIGDDVASSIPQRRGRSPGHCDTSGTILDCCDTRGRRWTCRMVESLVQVTVVAGPPVEIQHWLESHNDIYQLVKWHYFYDEGHVSYFPQIHKHRHLHYCSAEDHHQGNTTVHDEYLRHFCNMYSDQYDTERCFCNLFEPFRGLHNHGWVQPYYPQRKDEERPDSQSPDHREDTELTNISNPSRNNP